MSDAFQAEERGGDAIAAGQQSADALAKAGRETVRATSEAVQQTVDAMAARAETMARAAQAEREHATTAVSAGAEALSEGTRRFTERSNQGLQAAADYGRTLAQGFQEIAGEWASFARHGAERSVERMSALFQARTPGDLISAQRDLIWGGVEDLMGAHERVGQISLRMVGDATNRLAPSTSAPGLVA